MDALAIIAGGLMGGVVAAVTAYLSAAQTVPPRPGRVFFRQVFARSRSSREEPWGLADVSVSEGGLVVRRWPHMTKWNPINQSFSLDFEAIASVVTDSGVSRITLTNGEWIEVSAKPGFVSALARELKHVEPSSDVSYRLREGAWSRYDRMRLAGDLRLNILVALAWLTLLVGAVAIKITFFPNPR